MDAERISSLQARLRSNRSKVRTDEAARAALVLPFIQSLGYDIFDPEEVVPGFTRGQGRADFVVLDGDQTRMVISLAQDPGDLTSDRAMRLAECFANVGATTAVLTDGSLYRIHTDADQPGRMDEDALLSVELGGTADVDPSILTGLEKHTFDISSLASAAKTRRYEEAVRRAVGDELADPSETFIDLVSGRMQSAGFDPKDDLVQRVSALSLQSPSSTVSATAADGPAGTVEIASGDDRVTTADEMLGYHIVRALAARHIDPNRVVVRPAQSYCAILLDDNNRKSIARLHFNSQTVKYVGTFVDKKETRRAIPGPNGIYELEAFIVERLRELDPKAFGLAETSASINRDAQDSTVADDVQSNVEDEQPSGIDADAGEPVQDAPSGPETSDREPADPIKDDVAVDARNDVTEDEYAAVTEQPSVQTPSEPRMSFEDGLDLDRGEQDEDFVDDRQAD